MAGGMTRGSGRPMGERSGVNVRPPGVGAPARADRPRPVVVRHCWVCGLPSRPGRWAGILAEWRYDPAAGGWLGRVVYAVDEDAGTVLVETWVGAQHLRPAS